MPRFRAALTPAFRWVIKRNARIGQSPNNVPAAVGRAVVNYDQLEIGLRLRQRGVDRPADMPGLVVQRHDDGNFHNREPSRGRLIVKMPVCGAADIMSEGFIGLGIQAKALPFKRHGLESRHFLVAEMLPMRFYVPKILVRRLPRRRTVLSSVKPASRIAVASRSPLYRI